MVTIILPNDVRSKSVKDIKVIMKSLNISDTGLFEKADLVKKLTMQPWIVIDTNADGNGTGSTPRGSENENENKS